MSKATTTKMEGPGKETMIDLKKHEQGMRLAEWNCQNKEKLKAEKSKSKLTSSQYYGIEAIMAVRALGVLSYYVYQSKKRGTPKVTPVHQSKEGDMTPVQPSETRKVKME